MNSGNRGLLNLGNTCYMNSIVQCMSHLLLFHPNNECFIKACLQVCHKNDFEIVETWLTLQKQLWNDDSSEPINPKVFLECFIKKVQKYDLYFENFQQNDIDEFLNILIDIMHRSLKKTIKIEAHGTAENSLDNIALRSIESWKRFLQNTVLLRCPIQIINGNVIHVIK
jgi:ubiquitin C-terminal hydrolase